MISEEDNASCNQEDIDKDRTINNLKTENNSLEELAKTMIVIDTSYAIIKDVSETVKGIISKNPRALEEGFTKYLLDKYIGEEKFGKINEVYRSMIANKNI